MHRGACALVLLLLLGGSAATGCRACGRSQERKTSDERPRRAEPSPPPCSSAADCEDDDPCTVKTCVEFQCVSSPATEGKSCDNGNVCDGIERCNQDGQCVAGDPPVVDDGNACTRDACDPVRGVLHESLPVDDSNACTVDACDPRTGQITHRPLEVDDGDDCTADSCDPRSGARHERKSPSYTCNPACDPGFHSASRTAGADCAATGLRTFCAPDCGPSFYTCDATCPKGYRSVSKSANSQCGTALAAYTFCQKG
jgi:hypothetical protein